MTVTTLNLDAPKPIRMAPKDERCPQCAAPKDRRVNAGGFGKYAVILCENCGHEIKE